MEGKLMNEKDKLIKEKNELEQQKFLARLNSGEDYGTILSELENKYDIYGQFGGYAKGGAPGTADSNFECGRSNLDIAYTYFKQLSVDSNIKK
jgi:hypothetical protein